MTPRSHSGSRLLSEHNSTPASEVPQIFVGTSGWAYPTWKPGFYPADVSQKNFLAFYASRLNSVEVNYTFRALPTAAMAEKWLSATPSGFRFSFKAPQRITHFQRLRGSESALAEFLAALAPFRAAQRLGLALFQLPPNFQADLPRLADFLTLLRALPDAPPCAFEFRHASWFTGEAYALLRKHGCALCIAESDELQTPEIHTAPHIAYRLRRTDYTAAEITALAEKFRTLAKTHSLFIYFKHVDEPTGPLRASALLRAFATTTGQVADTPGATITVRSGKCKIRRGEA